jgi:hypothetical protein
LVALLADVLHELALRRASGRSIENCQAIVSGWHIDARPHRCRRWASRLYDERPVCFWCWKRATTQGLISFDAGPYLRPVPIAFWARSAKEFVSGITKHVPQEWIDALRT